MNVLSLSERRMGEKKKQISLRQLKKIITKPNETVFDFNTRYLEPYDQLEINDKVLLSVINYKNFLRPRFQIYE